MRAARLAARTCTRPPSCACDNALRDTIVMAARCDAASELSRMCHPISPFASHLCRTVMTVEDDHARRTTLAQQTHACTQAHYACVQACQMRTPVWQVSLLIIDFIFISYVRERPPYPSRITMWQWHETSAPGARGQGQAWHGVLVDWTVELLSSIRCESSRT